jgi:hypothetical protein
MLTTQNQMIRISCPNICNIIQINKRKRGRGERGRREKGRGRRGEGEKGGMGRMG